MRTVASHDDADPGEGSVVNQVKYAYNSWGLLAEQWQAHDGAIDPEHPENTPSVQYDYEDGASGGVAKYVRLDAITYPNGREISYGYGSTGAIDDVMSRLATIADTSGTLAAYSYLGLGRIVTEDFIDAEVRLDLNADSNLGGLDRFGRVVDQFWEDYDAEETIDEYLYTYDRAGNRTEQRQRVALGLR